MFFVEFAYDRSVHGTTKHSLFMVAHEFNRITPLDLAPILISERTCLDGKKKAKVIKALYEKIKQVIEQKNETY